LQLARNGPRIGPRKTGEIIVNIISRIIAAIGAVAVCAVIFLSIKIADAQQARALALMAAQDALVQGVDLTRIASFKYRDERTLLVTDDHGAQFKMEFIAPCPGLKNATDFSLVTGSYRDLDKFTGIELNGQVCPFKDFAPQPPQ
jgi:hypothetical protein